MNKTININLAQIFFQIDEAAFHQLKSYLDAIERSLGKEESKDEIIKDIEARIAELFLERQTNERQVITSQEVEQVIEIMGKPEDYLIEDEETPKGQSQRTERKPLYRDLDRGYLGGVSAGLDHYLNIDAVWIRLFWVLTTIFSYGIFPLIYVILWIVTPAAKTTAQKIAMKGKPVNLSTIEEDIKSNYKKVSEKVKNADYDKYKEDIKTGSSKFANWSENFLTKLVKWIGKIMGVFFIIIGGFGLLGLLIGFIAYSAMEIFGNLDIDNDVFVFGIPHWLQALTIFLTSGIIMFYLIILGLKLMNPFIRQLSKTAHITMLSLFVVSIAFSTFLGVRKGIEENTEAEVTEISKINIKPNDTLKVKMLANLKYEEHLRRGGEKLIYDDQDKILFSRDIGLKIIKSQDEEPLMSVVKKSEGYSMERARENASAISYEYDFKDNELMLNGYFTSTADNKNKDQKVRLYLYIPENHIAKFDENLSRFYLKSYNEDAYNISDSLFGHHLQLKKRSVLCTDCDTIQKKTQTNINQ